VLEEKKKRKKEKLTARTTPNEDPHTATLVRRIAFPEWQFGISNRRLGSNEQEKPIENGLFFCPLFSFHYSLALTRTLNKQTPKKTKTKTSTEWSDVISKYCPKFKQTRKIDLPIPPQQQLDVELKMQVLPFSFLLY
jgi:hypothetical protein